MKKKYYIIKKKTITILKATTDECAEKHTHTQQQT